MGDWNSNKQEVKDKKDKFKNIQWADFTKEQKDEMLRELLIDHNFINIDTGE